MEPDNNNPTWKSVEDQLSRAAENWNGKTYQTDKIVNGFMPDYERVLAPFREQAARVLEIGVYRGGSCMLWSDFFHHPDSQIVGLDLTLSESIVPTTLRNRVILEQCDQNDSDRLRMIAERFGPFDIIIDDGAHRHDETLNCYRVLFNYLRTGGYYVIEDWGVGYWKDQQHVFGNPNGNTMVTLITSIMQSIPDALISGYQIILDTHKCLAFFKKGPPWQS